MSLSEALLDGIYRRSGDPIIILDRGGFIDCNAAALRLYRLDDKAQFVGRHPADLSPPTQPDGQSSRQKAEAIVEQAFAEGHVLFEWEHRRGDGSRFFAEIMLVSFVLEGRPALSATVRDLTRRKETEQALLASQANLQLILDNLPGRVAWLAADRRHVYVNKQYEDFVGRPRDAIVGRTVADVLGETAYANLRSLGEAALAGEPQRWEGWLDYKDVGPRYVYRTYAPRRAKDGSIDGYFVFAMDVTDHKRAEEELARQREALHQSEKLAALGSLLAGVAHELNNPLSVVTTQSALLEETTTDPKAVARAGKIRLAADRCARIVRSFLSIARRKPPTRRAVDLREVVTGALDLTAYGLRASGVEVVLDWPPSLPRVWGDGDLLGQVFMNLFVNAEQAMQDFSGPRRLTVSAEAEGDRVRVRVADSGPGVPTDLRSRIFEPFFTTKAPGRGTGVGLSMCFGIVQSHSGTITLEETPGGGATLVVSLPRADEPAQSAGLVSPEEPQVSGLSILIVDDEPEIAEVLAEIVAPLAARVDMAGNGVEALSKLKTARYDVVVSDLRMPELDGPGLLRSLRMPGSGFSGRVIFVTGDTLGGAFEGFLKTSGVPVLEKPFRPDDVRRIVAETVG
ncbi:MAG TPA: PAS domain-containing protein [Beijerinckiaceae bacterium]|jgi:two-component system NtrC family sensor kinase